MTTEHTDSNTAAEPAAHGGWDGVERRRQMDRRSGERRLDERRRAGIGEIMGERREARGRRKTDFVAPSEKRDRRVTPKRRVTDKR